MVWTEAPARAKVAGHPLLPIPTATASLPDSTRDLKPANVKVKADGTVKVLDFGLAKAFQPEASGASASESPTISLTAAATQMGMVIGTAAYMSPEQAKGKTVDKRADVWAFGVVLFEMLTGTRPFTGDDVSETLARAIDREPDWAALGDSVAPALSNVLRRCLQKNPKKRIRDIGDVSLAMEGAFETGVPPTSDVAAGKPQSAGWRRTMLYVLAASVVGSLITGVAVWTLTRPAPLPPQPITRFAVVLPLDQQLTNIPWHQVAVSADGTHVAYVANQQLYLRAMHQLEATPIRGTDGGRGLFFSPDGQSIGFWQNGQLKRVAITGGAPVALCDAQLPLGASWGPEDTILIGQLEGIVQVSGAGAPPEVLIAVEDGEQARQPQILPGGEAVLFTLNTGGGSWDEGQVVAQSLETGERRLLVDGGTDARYVPTGHLVYAQGGTLFAVPFDVARLEVTGGPVSLIEDVVELPATGTAQFSVSRTGSLVYVPATSSAVRRLVWVDRDGREEPLTAEPRAYTFPRISPDGTNVALEVREDPETDIWIWDLTRETLTRLSFGPFNDCCPAWTPDGRRVVFSSNRAGLPKLFWKAADGTGAVERLTEGPNPHFAPAFSPDGTRLVFRESHPETGADLRVLSLDGERQSEPLLATEFAEQNPELSPDGRWIAYESNASGQAEIYVQPFPNVDEGRWPISTGGGTQPLWAPDGHELLYRAPGGAVMAVPVQTEPTFTAGNGEVVFEGSYLVTTPVVPGRTYDVAPDGQRFLMIKENAPEDEAAAEPHIVVVQHWFEELKARVPVP